MPVYRDFKEKHPEYDAEYMKTVRAWYAGGKKLLKDKELLDEVFPRHGKEDMDVYEERKKRAQYIAYPGGIIDSLVSELRSSPITIHGTEGEQVDSAWYTNFQQDCSAPGGKMTSVNDLVAECVREALIVQNAWVLVDLPSVALPENATVKDAEAVGAMDAYAMLIQAERVVNWETDASGELLYVMICEEQQLWGGLGTRRGDVKQIYTYYTAETWEKWSIVWKDGKEPKEDAPMTPEGNGTHSFKRVPIARLQLSEGLWAMNKLESIARAWFNKRNALDWSTYKNLFPLLYANVERTQLDPAGDEATKNLLNQKAGPGNILVLGEKEKLQYAQPDPGIYQACLLDLRDSRDEMHRVTFTMAQSVDNSGAALQRAASSKAQDRIATAIVLGELGNEGRKFVKQVYVLVAAGRQEELDVHIQGLDGYSDAMTEDLIEQTLKVETIDLPSESFHRLNKFRVAKSILGREATDDDLKKIREELDTNITTESIKLAQTAQAEGSTVKATVTPSKLN